MKIAITDEMRTQAKIESQKRDAFIKHHFEVDHLSYQERDELGFLGEFACCVALGIDWRKNIRENYYTIDDFDFIVNHKRIDLKTETVPYKYATKILNRTIGDDDLYGRRLINKNQFSLLAKYDIVVFGFFIRKQLTYWYPIGYIESRTIVENYPPTFKRPDGGSYPFPGSPVPTSILKPISDLR
jgi:hypothetical protein